MDWTELQQFLIDKVFLIGLTFIDKNEKIIDQYQTSGKVLKLSDDGIISLVRANDSVFQIPYDPETIFNAKKGEYREKSTGKIITDPDFISQWTIKMDDSENIEEIKKTGFS